jgi:hypothetical protein
MSIGLFLVVHCIAFSAVMLPFAFGVRRMTTSMHFKMAVVHVVIFLLFFCVFVFASAHWFVLPFSLVDDWVEVWS